MASYETLQKLQEYPEWIAPRSDTRVFLGEPGAPEATKTTVEPGNAFSPGIGTFGVTWWLRFPDEGSFYAPETQALESFRWSFENGYLPLIHCDTVVRGLEIRHSLFQDGAALERSEAVCGNLQISNPTPQRKRIQLFVALRSLGPAGGPVRDLKAGDDSKSFWLAERNLPLLGFDRVPDSIGCGVGDPSPLAREGKMPNAQTVTDPDGWCFGLARFDIVLLPRETWCLHFDCPQQSYGVVPDDLPGTAFLRPDQYEQRAEAHLELWRERLAGMELDVPDIDFHNAFFANLQHMLTATVGDQIRLAPIAYPLPWMRDGIIIMRCFDLAGFHELARKTTEICVRQDFFGGFCAEADAPGQGIWALVQHYRITRDRAWLERVYPAIQRKVDYLFRMRRTNEPIQIVQDCAVLPFMHAYRNAGVICAPAKNGIIMGVMDLKIREGQTNQWALCGLQEAAYAARELGREVDVRSYETEAQELRDALWRYIQSEPRYFEFERNVNSLVWPTRAWESETEKVTPGFEAWWARERGDEATYIPERWWLHFELGQIHNALLLGLRQSAWLGLKYRLDHQDVPGLYGWREYGGGFEEAGNAVNGVSLIKQLRGCHRFDQITPHGWCASEMWLLQRGMLVEEWKGELVLFGGVPAEWLTPGARIAFRNWVTWYGKVSAELIIEDNGHQARIHALGIDPNTPVRISLPSGDRVITPTADGKVSMTIEI